MPPITDNVQKELRNVMGVKALSILFKGGTHVSRDLYEKMNDYYHGTDTICSQLDLFMNTSGIYEVMFQKHYQCADHDYFLNTEIKKPLLQQKTKDPPFVLICGRQLHDNAMTAFANMKKAKAFLTMMPEVKALHDWGVEYESGNLEAEVKIKILQHMFIETKKQKKQNPEDDEDDDEPTQKSTGKSKKDARGRPREFYFVGWFAFCMFGRFVHEDDRIAIIETGSTKGVTKVDNGRKEQRKQKKLADDEKREKDVNNPSRGISQQMKLGMATLELQAEDLDARDKDRKLMALNSLLHSTNQSLDCAENRANKFCDGVYDASKPLWQNVIQLEDEVKKIQEQIKEMATSSSPSKKRTKFSFHESPAKKKKAVVAVDDVAVNEE